MKITIGLTAALVLLFGSTAPASAAAPTVTRQQLDFPVPIGACGIGTLDLSIDARSMVAIDDTRIHFTSMDVGAGWDPASGLTYHFVNHLDQQTSFPVDGVAVNTFASTIVITTAGGNGVMAREAVHTTVHPDGQMTADHSVQFVRCLGS